jgi:pyruvate/2-oxoglutarate dehydrogenase complex dihydrolipoamide dehydrogenase (E3) component
MAKDEYDLLVIGSGAAGSSAATTVAKNGRRVQRDGAYKRLTVRCGKSTTEELVVDEILSIHLI